MVEVGYETRRFLVCSSRRGHQYCHTVVNTLRLLLPRSLLDIHLYRILIRSDLIALLNVCLLDHFTSFMC